MESKLGVVMNPKDNVATAIVDIEGGDWVSVERTEATKRVKALGRVPFGFKIALQDISQGEPIIKYGEVIGKASSAIKEGALVHVHNVEGTRGRGDLEKEAKR